MDLVVQRNIDLVKASLQNSTFKEELTSEDYYVAKANHISGMVFKAIDKKNQNEKVYKLFQEDYYQYIRKDEIQQQSLKELRKVFNDNNIDYIFLKGSYLKQLYPETYMRSMGDIDILVRKEKMKEIHEILSQYNYKNWNNSTNHDCFFKDKVNIEIHPKLDSEFSDEFKDLFFKPWEYVKKINKNEYQLLPEYNLFYQLYHMIKHLYHSGVGFRTIVDIYIFLKHNQNNFSKDIYNMIYNDFPNKEFTQNILLIINEVFQDNLLFGYLRNDKIRQNVMRNFIGYLFASGVHGIAEDHNLFIGGMAKQSKSNRFILITKIKFLFSKTFLSYNLMRGLYPYLNKYKFLLPIAWLQRLFKLIFKKSSRRKLKRFSASRSQITEVENLFENIGI
ncbi:MAG: nucleotidyltransferase family protein [Candidatus Izimaplasma sp.]|nr:nucleotidyltransferase family protein [Candidatus Izimaplasma bacterium]